MIDEKSPILDEEQAVDHTHELISSRRVEGTPVYDRDGRKLGSIHSVMIEKRSGKVAYAVLSVGGFLGMRAMSTRCRGTSLPTTSTWTGMS
jgi:uncharacterized protein YrrD